MCKLSDAVGTALLCAEAHTAKSDFLTVNEIVPCNQIGTAQLDDHGDAESR